MNPFNFMRKYNDFRDIELQPAYNYLWINKERHYRDDGALFVEGLDVFPWADSDVLPVLAHIVQETRYYVTVEICLIYTL